LILTGRLVPRSIINDIRQDRDERIAVHRNETSVWREAYTLSEAARERQGDQLSVLVEYAKTADHLMKSIQDKVEG
jgi:hypothetical protein